MGIQAIKRINILGVRDQSLSTADKRFVLHELMRGKLGQFVVTVNPEIIMWAQKDADYKELLNKADFVLPDGVGLTFAASRKGEKLARWTGYDFVIDLMRSAEREKRSVFLLGGKPMTAHKSALTLKKLFPALRIAGAEEGPTLHMSRTELKVKNSDQQYLIEHLRILQPDILLVAFGHPKQEKWIAQSLHQVPSLRVAVGVGGVFDNLSGRIRRAPWIVRVLGLEWLFRVVRQPWRLPRIITAVIRFSLAVSRDR